VFQNVSLIDLTSWRANGKNNIYVTSVDPQTMVVALYK